jgi:aminodeoxychorismate lyase
MATIVRVNGFTTGLEEGRVAALDHGFLYGNGLFETMRAADGMAFTLSRHLKRLQAGGEVIGLPIPDIQVLRDEVAAALEDAGEPDAYVRLTVSRGYGAPGPDPSSCGDPTIVVVVKPFPPPPERWLTEGVAAETSCIRRNSSSPMTRVKSLNYMECILAKQAAKAHGADEALFLDTEGNLAEATAWNVFFVADGGLLTPDESGPILAGITRGIVLDLAEEADIPCQEGAYAPERLTAADEALLTNSLYGVVALGALDGMRIGKRTPGPVTRALAVDYERLRRRECAP